MSIKIMSAVFESQEFSPTEKLIMLSLADHANDSGECYPSISRLCSRTGLTERTIQTNIRNLQDRGYISIEMRKGRNGSNLYFVTTDPTPDTPPQEMHPAGDAPHPRRKCGSDPAGDAPKPSVTINEPSLPPMGPPSKQKRKKPKTPMPEGWAPKQEYAARLMDDYGLTKEEMVYVYEQFKGDAEAHDRRYVNWDAAYGNRVRSFISDGKIGPGSRSHRNGQADRDPAFD